MKKVVYTFIFIVLFLISSIGVYTGLSYMNRPLISVVMGTYNRGGGEDLLEQALLSILNQTEKRFEFIIINDGSTDNTAEILKKYQALDGRIKVLTNEENKGLVYSLNRGFDEAKGKYIARMDDDDLSLPTRFEKQVKFLEKHPNITATGCAFSFDRNKSNLNVFPSDPNAAKLLTFKKVPVVHPCAMIRRDFVEKNKIRYVDTYLYAEDMPFWREVIFKYGGLISNLREVLLIKRYSSPRKDNYFDIQNRSVWQYQADTFKMFLPPETELPYSDCLRFKAMRKAGLLQKHIPDVELEKYIKHVCPRMGGVPAKHPHWDDVIVFDSPDRIHLAYMHHRAGVLKKTDNVLVLKWDNPDWGIEVFRKTEDDFYELME